MILFFSFSCGLSFSFCGGGGGGDGGGGGGREGGREEGLTNERPGN